MHAHTNLPTCPCPVSSCPCHLCSHARTHPWGTSWGAQAFCAPTAPVRLPSSAPCSAPPRRITPPHHAPRALPLPPLLCFTSSRCAFPACLHYLPRPWPAALPSTPLSSRPATCPAPFLLVSARPLVPPPLGRFASPPEFTPPFCPAHGDCSIPFCQKTLLAAAHRCPILDKPRVPRPLRRGSFPFKRYDKTPMRLPASSACPHPYRRSFCKHEPAAWHHRARDQGGTAGEARYSSC